MVGVTGGGKLLGEWKLIRASAFWGLLARMASALKIKCPTLGVYTILVVLSFFLLESNQAHLTSTPDLLSLPTRV